MNDIEFYKATIFGTMSNFILLLHFTRSLSPIIVTKLVIWLEQKDIFRPLADVDDDIEAAHLQRLNSRTFVQK